MALADNWYLVGPLMAIPVVGVLAAVLRWTLGREQLQPAPPLADDFGLLRVAALVDRLEVAQALRKTLRRAGIRSTLSTGPDGGIKILVFPDDAGLARRVLERDGSA